MQGAFVFVETLDDLGSYFGLSGIGGIVVGAELGSGQVPAGYTGLEDRKHGKKRYRYPQEMGTWLAHDHTVVDFEATSSAERIVHQAQKGSPSSDNQKIRTKRGFHVRLSTLLCK
ncbi:hypothetical protein PG989_012747 [Apiospora arundinis]